MAVKVNDVNKSVIMNMLRTDVFGFTAEDIEEKAKEVSNLVINGGEPGTLPIVAGYGRTESGNIAIFYNGFFHQKQSETKSSKSKKK